MAKLTPEPSHVAPRGEGWPGQTRWTCIPRESIPCGRRGSRQVVRQRVVEAAVAERVAGRLEAAREDPAARQRRFIGHLPPEEQAEPDRRHRHPRWPVHGAAEGGGESRV